MERLPHFAMTNPVGLQLYSENVLQQEIRSYLYWAEKLHSEIIVEKAEKGIFPGMLFV